jgi:hypothetical protein
MFIYAIEIPYEGISGSDIYLTVESRREMLDTHYSYITRWLEVTIEIGPNGSEVISRELITRGE